VSDTPAALPTNLSTYEKATRCPKCTLPGILTKTHAGVGGAKVESWTCDNERCKWYTTGWIIQINPDGSIPERRPGPKQFEPLSPGMETAARDYLRSIEQEEEDQLRERNG
jgi:hypothetical protein